MRTTWKVPLEPGELVTTLWPWDLRTGEGYWDPYLKGVESTDMLIVLGREGNQVNLLTPRGPAWIRDTSVRRVI